MRYLLHGRKGICTLIWGMDGTLVSDAKRLHSCRKRKQVKPTKVLRAKQEHKGRRYVLLRPDDKRTAHPVLPSVLQPNVCVVVPFAKMQQPSNPVTAAVRYKEGHHKDVHVCVSTSLRCSGWPVDVVVVPISTGECHIYTPNGKEQ